MSKFKADNFFESLGFAISGLLLATKSQRNLKIEIILGMVSVMIGAFLDFSMLELAVLIITIGFVLVAELINTIVEFVVDSHVGNQYSKLAKMSKDIAAGMVLMCVILACVIGFLLFAPKILRLLV